MKTNRTPTTVILLFFSWLIAIVGFVNIVVHVVIFRLSNMNALSYDAIVLLVSLLLATIVRAFANIGQMIFDLKADTEKIVFSTLRENTQKQGELNKIVNEAGCSLGKMSQDVYEIKNFFENVEKRLDLKKAQEKE